MEHIIHRLMLGYQQKNNIKNNCITNAQYLYDQINRTSPNKVKARAVFVVNEEKGIFCRGHLVLEYDDKSFIDPSYEYESLNNSKYFTTIHDLNLHKSELDKSLKKEIISDHLRFTKYAERINQGELVINDKKYYDDQHEYIHTILQSILNFKLR
jgi:hypothetical protein